MIDLEVFTPESFANKSNKTLFLCDESFITCANLPRLRNLGNNPGSEMVLGIPSYEYQKGKRGWAKAQILASVVPIQGVLTLGYEEALDQIQQGKWANVLINGKLIWTSSESITTDQRPEVNLNITETTDLFDIEMIKRAKQIKDTSNCWLDPAATVFTKDESILIEAASTSYNNSLCHDLPINFTDLPLDSGERMIFCDSLHAERVGISQAAETNVELHGSTMYITKYPCRPCTMSAIAAGVQTIVFETGSYGLLETADLIEANNIKVKKVK